MADEQVLSQTALRQLLRYAPETGSLIWCVSRGKAAAGSIAGVHDAHGYIVIRLFGILYKAHRLVWLYVNGEFPSGDIDHVNGVRDDNRIDNLRDASRAQNQQNMKLYANNTSGYPGVVWDKSRGKWAARINVGGVMKNLGRFSEPGDAFLAYQDAKRKHHAFNPSVPQR